MTVMHISDLHFGIPDKTLGGYVEHRQMILDSFLNNLSILPSDLLPDVLVITGDIGYSGSEDDYIKAKEFILEIINRLKGKITTNDIIICPGNHDVLIPPKRRRQEARPQKDRLEVEDLEPLTRDNIEASIYKFDNYIKFLKDLNICELENRAMASDGDNAIHYLYGYRELKGIQFIVLNSEWDFFGKDDKNAEGCLRLGADLVADALDYVNDQEDTIKPVIAIFHRPFIPNIHISERNIYKKKDYNNVDYLLNANTDMILNGHVHIGNASSSYGSRAWSFSCGTLHSIDVETPEFWLFKFEGNYYKAIKYKWNFPNARNRKGHWLQDTESDCYEKIWTIGNLNHFETEDQHLQFLERLITDFNNNQISKEEAMNEIQNRFPSLLQSTATRLFDQAILNASNKDLEQNKISINDYQKELTYCDTDNNFENIKEVKEIHE